MAHNDDAYGRMMWDFHRGIPAEEIAERDLSRIKGNCYVY